MTRPPFTPEPLWSAALAGGRPLILLDHSSTGVGSAGATVVLAAADAQTRWVAWTVRHSSGFLFVPLPADRADSLELPPMVGPRGLPAVAQAVAVDAADGITTGISAADRSRTARVLADPASSPADLRRPGHVIPLRIPDDGTSRSRFGTAADLCAAAGRPRVALAADLVGDDGELLGAAAGLELARRFDLPTMDIATAVQTARRPGATSVARVRRHTSTVIPTDHGSFRVIGYADLDTGAEHLALVALRPPALATAPLVRVHSECLTGEALGSRRCDCGPQLSSALARIGVEGGAVIYLRGHEGRGIGLLEKLAAYRLQDHGADTVSANLDLGHPADAREYGAAVAILQDLEIDGIRLLTGNPAKSAELSAGGVHLVAVEPLAVGATIENAHYRRTKRDLFGHAGHYDGDHYDAGRAAAAG